MAIVEDEEGTVASLVLHKQSKEGKVQMVGVMQPGDVFITKELLLETISTGLYTLHVAHVSDIIRLQGADGLMPMKWWEPASDFIGSQHYGSVVTCSYSKTT
ncbi:hypothetical protein F4776DRAFT_305073 [Hypoxylon sp. NC0597]|nr:hypothetical protein F4776DRAFT_305073 [Hypoxylon sp. NC0597]